MKSMRVGRECVCAFVCLCERGLGGMGGNTVLALYIRLKKAALFLVLLR